jgi:hypothetical protein
MPKPHPVTKPLNTNMYTCRTQTLQRPDLREKKNVATCADAAILFN